MEVREIIKDYNDFAIRGIDSNYQSLFQYRNGSHLLFITKIYNKFYLCGLGTGFYVICHKNNYDVYKVFNDIVSAVREYEKFISLLLATKKVKANENFGSNYSSELF